MGCSFCVLVCLFLVNFIQGFVQEKPYSFRPESRHIDINDGDDYYIGFFPLDDTTKFGHCYIQSETINADYPIFAPDTNDHNTFLGDSTGFKPDNGTSLCAFVYYKVDDQVPLKWIITAYDIATKTNFTEEVTITFYYNMPLFLTQMVGLETSTVVNFYEVDTTKLIKCTLSFDNSSIDLDLNSIKLYNDDHIFKSRLFSLGGGKCGFKITNLSANDSTDLTLYATNNNNKVFKNGTRLVVEIGVSEYLKNRTIEVYLGDTAFIVCGKGTDTSANYDQKFCYLYNPQGELVSHDHMCDLYLDIVTVEDLGIWTCSVGYDYIMETMEFTTELVQNGETIISLTENSKDYFTIGCQFLSFESKVDYCRFTRPDGKMFKVVKGSATVNYDTFSTDIDNGKCGLDILKPLRPEDEGTWKCEASLFNSEVGGIFIDVERAKSFRYKRSASKNVRLGNPFTIDCEIPFASTNCYIEAPNGTQYKPKSELETTTGVCFFEVGKSTSTDNGPWKCSIARDNGIPDEIITVEISIIELTVRSINIEAGEDDEVNLLCNTNDVPIEYCRFISPSGTSYTLKKDNSSYNGISYVGRGLEYGDCGMEIQQVKLSQSGEWFCHLSPGRSKYINKADLTRAFAVSVKPTRSSMGLAESVGIGVGVVVAIIAVAGVLFYRNSDRICSRGNARDSNHSTSGESVILSVSQNTLYNTASP